MSELSLRDNTLEWSRLLTVMSSACLVVEVVQGCPWFARGSDLRTNQGHDGENVTLQALPLEELVDNWALASIP